MMDQPTEAPCKHLNYEMDEAGYYCQDCQEVLVYCWLCVEDIVKTGVTKPHVHAMPVCDDTPHAIVWPGRSIYKSMQGVLL